jgi:hypothetical protein
VTAPLGLAQAEITLISARGRFIDGSTDSQKGTQQARSSNSGLEKQCEWKRGSEIQRSKIMAAFQTAQVHDHGLTRTAGDRSLSFTPQLAERSSPSRVRCAAQNPRALDCSGPFYGFTVMKEREPLINDSNTCASRWSGMRHSGWGIFQPVLWGFFNLS